MILTIKGLLAPLFKAPRSYIDFVAISETIGDYLITPNALANFDDNYLAYAHEEENVSLEP